MLVYINTTVSPAVLIRCDRHMLYAYIWEEVWQPAVRLGWVHVHRHRVRECQIWMMNSQQRSYVGVQT